MPTPSSHVLVLSGDPMVAALLGMLAELASFTPAFAREGEQPGAALARVRPLFVVLLDGAMDEAQSDIFYALAARHRVGLALFGRLGGSTGAEEQRRLAEHAIRRGVPYFDVPTDLDAFRRVLAAADEARWWEGRGDRRRTAEAAARTADPDSLPHTERSARGALVYVDRTGHRWLVFDRRGSDRRLAARRDVAPASGALLVESGRSPTTSGVDGPESTQRVFLSDSGEVREYALAWSEVGERSAMQLERQLAAAQPV